MKVHHYHYAEQAMSVRTDIKSVLQHAFAQDYMKITEAEDGEGLLAFVD